MKLIDILARELKEWPKAFGDVLGQRSDGTLHGYNSAGLASWIGGAPQLTRCDNYMCEIVTRAQWQEAREALGKTPPISEAPKDATHWDPGLKCTPSWVKFKDGKWFWWPVSEAAIEIGWRPYLAPDFSTFIEIARPWLGEGLPPIGVVCENVFPGDIWREVIIIAHDGDMAVFRLNNSDRLNYFGDTEQHFRPIRTPEQIAADDRTKAIDELVRVACINRGEAGRIYDAGYRRQDSKSE